MSKRAAQQEKADRDAQQAAAEAEAKKVFFQRRVSLVKEGAKAAALKRYGDATSKFHTFIRTMEEYKGATAGGLTPATFDVKKEFADYVLVTEVFWELSKIYDRVKIKDDRGKEKTNPDLQRYLDKYISFAKGVSFEKRFEKLCGERLRKFIQNDKPMNREIFKTAYFKMTGSKCFIATSVMEELDPKVFRGLRVYRDRFLAKVFLGRVFIFCYYQCGPLPAFFISKSPQKIRNLTARMIERFYFNFSKKMNK
jgi:hypothetical protein